MSKLWQAFPEKGNAKIGEGIVIFVKVCEGISSFLLPLNEMERPGPGKVARNQSFLWMRVESEKKG